MCVGGGGGHTQHNTLEIIMACFFNFLRIISYIHNFCSQLWFRTVCSTFIHSFCSQLMLTIYAQNFCSRLLFTHFVHTFCSQILFTAFVNNSQITRTTKVVLEAQGGICSAPCVLRQYTVFSFEVVSIFEVIFIFEVVLIFEVIFILRSSSFLRSYSFFRPS